MLGIFKETIRGCEARGDGDSVYMIRYGLPRVGPFRLCLHVFYRSDADDLHDHPWGFVSMILWRGYVEVTGNPPVHALITRGAGGGVFCRGCLVHGDNAATLQHIRNCRVVARRRKRIWPGMILFRRATHKHRVELLDGKRAVTLVMMGPRWRDRGFFTPGGWLHWRTYFADKGC